MFHICGNPRADRKMRDVRMMTFKYDVTNRRNLMEGERIFRIMIYYIGLIYI